MSGEPRPATRLPRRGVSIACAIALAAVAVLVTWLVTRPPTTPATLPHATCGRAVTHLLDGSTQGLSADPGALGCFSSAARGCRAASIVVVEMGVDTGTDYVFTLQPGGTPCRVTELSQYYSANFGGSTGPVITTSCVRRAVTGTGVMLRCAGQDLLIPATVVPRIPSRRPSAGRSSDE